MRLANELRASFGAAAIAGLLLAAPVGAATITIVNNDGPGEGFNDPTPAAPVGGNPGVTIGQQRLNVFQHAANIWGALLPSTVEIRVNAQFNPLACAATSGVLGSAGATFVFSDFPGAPFANTWYSSALADRLASAELNPGPADINATFNSNLGQAGCLTGAFFYYGLDGNEGSLVELLPVVLHELGHGLGFQTFTNRSTGVYFNGLPSIYDRFLYDLNQNQLWIQMTDAQRVASAISCQKLAWDGPSVRSASGLVLAAKRVLRVTSPPAAAGDYEVGSALFGAPLTEAGVTGPVVLADDGVAPGSDACTPLVNNLAGAIAIVDRGTCAFAIKVKACQDAGAIGVIVVDNVANACPPADMGGADPSIVIPAVRVSQENGSVLKANLVGQQATLFVDPIRRQGGAHGGRVLMYTPNPLVGGSSVSHFDTSPTPNLLMEPAINNSLSSNVDLTLNLFADIGWLDAATATRVAPGYVQAGSEGVRIEFVTSDAASQAWTAERTDESGDWTSLGSPELVGSNLLVVEDGSVVPGTRYGYRVTSAAGESEIVWVDVPTAAALALSLEGARPNPAVGRFSVAFTLPAPAPARLDLVNVAGRIVDTIDLGQRAPGRHVVDLTGRRTVPAGTYFLRLTQGGKSVTSSVVLLD